MSVLWSCYRNSRKIATSYKLLETIDVLPIFIVSDLCSFTICLIKSFIWNNPLIVWYTLQYNAVCKLPPDNQFYYIVCCERILCRNDWWKATFISPKIGIVNPHINHWWTYGTSGEDPLFHILVLLRHYIGAFFMDWKNWIAFQTWFDSQVSFSFISVGIVND